MAFRRLNRALQTFLHPGFSKTGDQLWSEMQAIKLLMGESLAKQIRAHGIYDSIQEAEFKVFSQFGDDGIIQYLIHQTKPEIHSFIEFGVEDYSESNTLFLLRNNNWKGLVIDADFTAMQKMTEKVFYWQHDLKAVGAFITSENINQLFIENGFTGEIGLLSIDIDGNDYWIWKSIEVVNPVIVIVEYNSVFGSDHAITIPYDPNFVRTKAHDSNLYWGCSLKALCLLAEKKGYIFAGSNRAGNNAYFIRKDKKNDIPALSCKEGYVESRFRESRDADGHLTFLAGSQRMEKIKELMVFDIEQEKLIKLGDLKEDGDR
jgi:hypothetical protein